MQIKILFSIFIFITSHFIAAQDIESKKIKKNLIYLEGGGAGAYGSINYEYLFKTINHLKLSTRIGLSTYRLKDYTEKFNPDFIIPITLNVYYGIRHHIDLGLGPTITSIVYANHETYQPQRRTLANNTNLFIGYRYQKEDNKVMFKIGYAPIIEQNHLFRNWYLLAFGYSF